MKIKTIHWYAKVLLGILFLAVIGVYAYAQTNDFAQGPEITISTPEGGTMIEDPLITVEGMVRRVAEVDLNGARIYIDEEGNFREYVLLVPGQNIITLHAKDKFGREVKEVVELLYNPQG